MKLTNFNILIALFIFSIAACQMPDKNKEQTSKSLEENNTKTVVVNQRPTVDPPLKGIDVPMKEYNIEAGKGGTIRLENGSYIVVPANAFTSLNGEPVKGKVKLEYREFHDVSAIIASGIPMQNKGEDRYMETAGMFEINGSDEAGNPVLINQEKSLEVNMASFVEGENFDFFHLDQKNCKWENKVTGEGKIKPKVNKAKKELLANLPVLPEKPSMPEKANEKDFVFDLNVNYKNFPELKAFHGVVWQYNSKNGAPNPEKNEWVFKEDWKDINLEVVDAKKAVYRLELKTKDKSFTTEVNPVLKGINYEKALAEFKSKTSEYAKVKGQRIDEEKRAEAQADLIRSFNVNKFGIFNWDIWKQPSRLAVRANFDFGSEVNMDVYKPVVFLITESNRSVVTFNQATFDKFSFEPGKDNKLVAILPGNEIAAFGPKDFKGMDLNKIRSESKPSYTFKMKNTKRKVSSFGEFQNVMQEIVL